MNKLKPNQVLKITHTQIPCPNCNGKGVVDQIEEMIKTAEPEV